MIHKVNLPRRDLDINHLKMDDNVVSYTHKLAIEVAKKVDQAILEKLYQLYLNKADTLVVIDETKFEEFIRKYLPFYLKEIYPILNENPERLVEYEKNKKIKEILNAKNKK